MLALERVFPIFPSPRGCDVHGAKIELNATFEAIAKDMKMRRPRTERLADPGNPPHGMVLKLEYSDTSRDVYIPKRSGLEKGVEKAAAFVKERTDASWDCGWLAQEYVPFLPFGEIRFIMVDGSPVRDIVTGRHPDNHPTDPGQLWSYESNDSLKNISELQ